MSIRRRNEVAIDIIERNPRPLVDLIEHSTGQRLPEYERAESESDTGTGQTLVFRGEEGEPLFAVVMDFPEHPWVRKRFDWPFLLHLARMEHQCPALLVIVAESHETAEWARDPIDCGFGLSSVKPVVACVDEFGAGHPYEQLLTVAAKTASFADKYRAEFMEDLFGDSCQREKVLGTPRAMLMALTAGKFVIPRHVRREVLACQNGPDLDRWFRRVVGTGDTAWRPQERQEGNRD